jgi:hypothetical protein
MATLVVIGGGEQDYREGARPYEGEVGPDYNVQERIRRDRGEDRENARSERLERRYQRRGQGGRFRRT